MSAPCISPLEEEKEKLGVVHLFLLLMLFLFAAGSLSLWVGSIFSLFLVGGFNGIICWQGQGILYLFFANYITDQRLKETKDGSYVVKGFMRWRLKALYKIVLLNIIGNVFSILLIIYNLVIGRLHFTDWDRWSFISTGVVIAVLGLIGLMFDVKVLENAWTVFMLVVVTRIEPQSMLSVSKSLPLISWLVLGGLWLIAFQRFVISLFEFQQARKKGLTKKNRTNAWLLSGSDGLNFGSAFIPAIVKAVRF